MLALELFGRGKVELPRIQNIEYLGISIDRKIDGVVLNRYCNKIYLCSYCLIWLINADYFYEY